MAAEHDAVGMHEVIDGAALTEELRVAHHGEMDRLVGPVRGHDFADQVAGANWHRALVDDHQVVHQLPADVLGGSLEGGQVGTPSPIRGRADGHENELSGPERIRDIS